MPGGGAGSRREGRGAPRGPGGAPVRVCVRREQALLKTLVVDRDTEAWQRDPAFAGLQRVGGVDVSFVKGDSASACASLVVLSYPELEVTRRGSPSGSARPSERGGHWTGRGRGGPGRRRGRWLWKGLTDEGLKACGEAGAGLCPLGDSLTAW